MTPAFEELRNHVKSLHDRMPSVQRNVAQNVVARLGVCFVTRLSEQDFLVSLDIGCAVELVPVVQPKIAQFLDLCDVSSFQGVSPQFVQNALVIMVAFWFQRHAHPFAIDGWRLPDSVPIGGAIEDRLQAIREATRQRVFLNSLGKPSEPARTDPRLKVSPTTALESQADLSAQIKVNVLRNYLEARNRAGITCIDGVVRTGFLQYHRRSLEAACRFFDANPEVSVRDLTDIIDACCTSLQMPLPDREEDDSQKHLRSCRSLSYLLLRLRQVVRESGFDLPIREYPTKTQLFGVPGKGEPSR